MKIKDLTPEQHKILEEIDINIAEIINLHQFKNHIRSPDKTYRDLAIERLITGKYEFTSIMNLIHEMMLKFVHIICPHCNTEMDYKDGGGGDSWTLRNKCNKCNCSISITIPSNGISVRYD